MSLLNKDEGEEDGEEDGEEEHPWCRKQEGPEVETRLRCPQETERRPVQLVHSVQGRDQREWN